MSPQRINETLVNNVGILVTDTWQYYKRTFGCLNLKGTGIEINYYLLRPIYLQSKFKTKIFTSATTKPSFRRSRLHYFRSIRRDNCS